MVSFSCEVCNETLLKKKVRNHYCRNASYTCLDCNKTFYGQEYNAHNQCISEAEKYEKSMYNPKKKNGRNGQQPPQKQEEPKKEVPVEEPKKEEKKEEKKKKNNDEEDSLSAIAKIINGPTDLYKIVKKLEKSTKKDKKNILKSLTVEKGPDGTIILKPTQP